MRCINYEDPGSGNFDRSRKLEVSWARGDNAGISELPERFQLLKLVAEKSGGVSFLR